MTQAKAQPKLKLISKLRGQHCLRYDMREGTLTYYSRKPITLERLNLMLDRAKRDLLKEFES